MATKSRIPLTPQQEQTLLHFTQSGLVDPVEGFRAMSLVPGMGEFATVTQPTVFDQVLSRFGLDTENMRGLRDLSRRQQAILPLFNVLMQERMNAPTAGEAQPFLAQRGITLTPENQPNVFTPGVPAQGPGRPTLTPDGQEAQRRILAGSPTPDLELAQLGRQFGEKREPFFEEGSQPEGTPPQLIPGAKVSPFFSDFVRNIAGRVAQPLQPNAAMLIEEKSQRLEKILAGAPELYEGEKRFLERRIELFSKEAPLGSVERNKVVQEIVKLQADTLASIQKREIELEQKDKQLEKIQSEIDRNLADAKLDTERARLEERKTEANEDRVRLSQERAQLQQEIETAKRLLLVQTMGDLPKEQQVQILDMILGQSNLGVGVEQRPGFLGIDTGKPNVQLTRPSTPGVGQPLAPGLIPQPAGQAPLIPGVPQEAQPGAPVTDKALIDAYQKLIDEGKSDAEAKAELKRRRDKK